LGHPEQKFQAIHVVGTNGKGTTAYALHQILMANGIRSGLYTSPHLRSYCERFVIDDRMIPKKDFEKIFNLVWAKAKQIKQITEFEVLTAMALLWFAKQKIEIAVLEAGLGGRFDATNVFNFVMTLVPSISLDHENILGPGLENIYFEKLAVLKNSQAALLGNLDNVLLQKTLDKLNLSPKKIVLHQFLRKSGQSNLQYNQLLAQMAGIVLQLPGFPQALKPLRGRLEILSKKPLIIFDVAHNPEAMRNLVLDLKAMFPGKKFEYFLGVLKRKDAPAMVAHLPRRLNQVPVEAEEPYDLLAIRSKQWINHPTLKDALRWIRKNRRSDTVYVFTGSFYLSKLPSNFV
jgi:dihydrofolate synthase/folylpolyglutamate synthase